MPVSQIYHFTLGAIIFLVAVLIVAKRFGGKGGNAGKSGGNRSRNRNRNRRR